jgi:GntR family transcriptional regulator
LRTNIAMARRTTQHSSRAAQRTLRYQEIANTLRKRLTAGRYANATVLPSESELSDQFGASRVTVRRALEVLREEGLVTSRQGLGWTLVAGPMPQSLGRLGTIEEQLLASGVRSARQIVDFAFERAPKLIAQLLNTDQVLRVKRVNLADDEPFAVVTVWCSLALGRKLSRRDVERSSFYELIDVPLKGATQTIAADAASKTEAKLLAIKPGSPVLRCERTTRDVRGNVVLYSQHVFPAHRTNFVVDLPSVARSIAPSGLRLVE